MSQSVKKHLEKLVKNNTLFNIVYNCYVYLKYGVHVI